MFIRVFLCLLGVIVATNAAPEIGLFEKMSYMKSVMRPYGCYDVQIPEEERINKKCLMKCISEFLMMDHSNMDASMFPNLRKFIEKMTLCRLEELDLLDGDKIDMDRMAELMATEPVEGKAADVAALNAIYDSCVNSETDESLTGVQNSIKLHHCIRKDMIENCAPTGNMGFKVPLMYALETAAMDNPTCTAVKVSPEIKDTYVRCIKMNAGDGMETEKMKLIMEEGPKIMSAVLNGLKMLLEKMLLEIPELKCMKQSAEKLGLMENEGPNFPNIADIVASFSGWDADAKNIVVSKIKECGMKFESLDDPMMRGIETAMCFLPTYAETCGLNNELSRNFLFPHINADFMRSIFKRICDMFNIRKMMDKFMEKM